MENMVMAVVVVLSFESDPANHVGSVEKDAQEAPFVTTEK